MPLREELDARSELLDRPGGPTKADLRVIDLGQGPLVVKDFAHKRWWIRLAGRAQIFRECRAYRWLGEMTGIPEFVGRVDAHALAIRKLEAGRLVLAPDRARHGATWLSRLREVVARLHAAGVVHLDLRGQENVLIDGTGQVYVIDLASAVCLRPGGFLHRLFFRRLRFTDEAALLKWKRMLDAGPLTDDEQALVRRFEFWRSLWIFNPKRRTRPKPGG